MNYKNLVRKIYEGCLFAFTTLIISGCRDSGGGGGLLGDLGASSSTIGNSGSNVVSTSSLTTVANPEPSSILLLTSGLIGMAIYAKARFNNRNKK